MKISFIGVGVMGEPIAQNLQSSGQHELTVYDIDSGHYAVLREMGAAVADSTLAAVAQADLVMTSLPGPRQVAEVALGADGILAHMHRRVGLDRSQHQRFAGRREDQAGGAGGRHRCAGRAGFRWRRGCARRQPDGAGGWRARSIRTLPSGVRKSSARASSCSARTAPAMPPRLPRSCCATCIRWRCRKL